MCFCAKLIAIRGIWFFEFASCGRRCKVKVSQFSSHNVSHTGRSGIFLCGIASSEVNQARDLQHNVSRARTIPSRVLNPRTGTIKGKHEVLTPYQPKGTDTRWKLEKATGSL